MSPFVVHGNYTHNDGQLNPTDKKDALIDRVVANNSFINERKNGLDILRRAMLLSYIQSNLPYPVVAIDSAVETHLKRRCSIRPDHNLRRLHREIPGVGSLPRARARQQTEKANGKTSENGLFIQQELELELETHRHTGGGGGCCCTSERHTI